MPICFHCDQKPVFSSDRALCKKHFIKAFEEKVRKTIREFSLFDRSHKLAVASSGGKDSTTVLYVLKNLGYDVEALAINEGIHGYRDGTLEDLKAFCALHSINLKIASYKEHFGFTLDELLKAKKVHPCMACGVLRRNLLNRASRGYDRLVTGHNLDDEAQSIMMNMIKSNTHLFARLGPKTGVITDSRFTQRVKPLYLCSEKEVATYAFLQDFQVKFTECPNAKASFRAKIRDMLNELESKNPGSKMGMVRSFLKLLPSLKSLPVESELVDCQRCGEPSSRQPCMACAIGVA